MFNRRFLTHFIPYSSDQTPTQTFAILLLFFKKSLIIMQSILFFASLNLQFLLIQIYLGFYHLEYSITAIDQFMEEVQENCHADECPIIVLFSALVPNNLINNQTTSILEQSQFSPANLKFASDTADSEGRDCRICLEGEDGGRLAKYCQCTGTAELCHEECLRYWITRKLSDSKIKIHCEICLKQYDYDEQIEEKFSYDYFTQKLGRKKRKIISFMALYFVSMICLFTFLGFLVEGGSESGVLHTLISSNRLVSMILIVVLIFWTMIMVVVGSVFIRQYFFKKELTIKLRKYVKTYPKRYSSLNIAFKLKKRSFER